MLSVIRERERLEHMDFDVGARLKVIRKSMHLSQRELASKAGVTNGMISLIEGNKTSPSISSLKKISCCGQAVVVFFWSKEKMKQIILKLKHLGVDSIVHAVDTSVASGAGRAGDKLVGAAAQEAN